MLASWNYLPNAGPNKYIVLFAIFRPYCKNVRCMVKLYAIYILYRKDYLIFWKAGFVNFTS